MQILNPSILSAETLQQSVHVFKMDSMAAGAGARDDFGNTLEEEGAGAGGGDSSLTVTTASTPLYKLKLGVASSSDGLGCAAAAGVPASIVRRAAQVKAALVNNTPLSAYTDLNRDSIASRPQVCARPPSPVYCLSAVGSYCICHVLFCVLYLLYCSTKTP
jgi:hypothetical protein